MTSIAGGIVADTLTELLQRSGLDLPTLTTVINTLARNPILQGKEVDVIIPAGQSTGTSHHGLGRAMRGSFVMGVSSTDLVPVVYIPFDDGKLVTVVTTTPAAGDAFIRIYCW
jgi:hypothetical protein